MIFFDTKKKKQPQKQLLQITMNFKIILIIFSIITILV
ncbi:hypothetical protein HSACCH_00377 [Halanaerobium saccharolyticum subsp. saccharolyticum DSM 6643]|uniref:Uncharacterized protein n=1 Tax=Halanaerobium saccharolyticum subsp. saccharolyticum DSM 6643 TaxID=1293054 RepID=M5DXG9_9FIRM|nr:hypothetical protein HSACCH_00377 [Halanaerobium saccharolyticum subsp. saccharolyticum DSM 6643]